MGKHDGRPNLVFGVISDTHLRTSVKGAKLEVFLDKIEKPADNNPVNPVQEASATPRLRVRIPLADGNPDSRVYAYEVVVAGDEGTPKLRKAVYAAGVNTGVGREPNGGGSRKPL